MTLEKLKVSIVIPVYNEERNIKACLDTIRKQTTQPYEVIVVDNNCSDRTIDIARKYVFVKVVKEPNQGRGYARTAGFNSARGEIIGRIDADSRLSPDWVERVLVRFSADPDLQGLTGMAKTSFLPGIESLRTTLFTRSYYWYVHAGFHTTTMWGANMAVRKTAWEQIASDVCNDDALVHEDQDVSICIAANGGKIMQDNLLRITTSGQTYRYLPKVLKYKRLYISTKKRHKKNGNLSSDKLIRLPFFSTLPGLLWFYLLGSFLSLVVTLLFPIDLLMIKVLKQPQWVDERLDSAR